MRELTRWAREEVACKTIDFSSSKPSDLCSDIAGSGKDARQNRGNLKKNTGISVFSPSKKLLFLHSEVLGDLI
jgi:hypothetical protein